MRAQIFRLTVATGAMTIALLPMPVLAQTATPATTAQRLSLPSQNLGEALARIAARFGTKLNYDKVAIRHFRSSPVVDAATAEDAVYQALVATGLSVTRSADGTSLGIGMPDPARLADDIIVTAPRNQAETSYKADSSETGTRTGGPSRSLPAAISVVTAKVLKEQQAQTIDDAVRNVASVSTSLSNAQGAQFYQVRGFNAPTLSNGVVSPASEYQSIDAVERVEVLKGPAAILSGEGGLGGVVNVVNKKPTTTTLLNVQAQAGSYGEYKLAIDGSTPLDEDGRWSARMVMSGLHLDRNFGGYDGGKQYLLNPSLRYKDASLDVTAGINYTDFDQPFQSYSLFGFNSTQILKRSGPIGFRNAGFKFETTTAYLDAEYKIAPGLTFVARGAHVDQNNSSLLFLPLFFLGSNTSLLGIGGGTETTGNTWSGDSYLRAKVETGPLRHTLSAGYNISAQHSSQLSLDGGSAGGYIIVDPTGDASLPDYTGYTRNQSSLYRNFVRSQGYYLQDLIEFGPFHVFGALRRNLYYSRGNSLTSSSTQRGSAWTPSGGVVFDVTKDVSIYANYVRGYFPTSALDVNNNLLPPIQSVQYEGGTKIDLHDHKATLTLSGFQISQRNSVSQVGFGADGQGRFELLGGLRTRGIEGELLGEIVPGWNVTLSGTRSWYDPIDQGYVGFRSPSLGLTRLRGNLWSSFTVQNGPAKNLGFAVGLVGQGRTRTRENFVYPNGFTITELNVPGYVRTDLSVYYKLGPIDAAFGVRNVFDRTDYASSTNPTYVAQLPPRTFRLTLTYHAFGK